MLRARCIAGMNMFKFRQFSGVLAVVCALCLLLGCSQPSDLSGVQASSVIEQSLAYNGSPYEQLNGNVPAFTEQEITDKSFEYYSELDSLGRCGAATACIGQDIMPTEERGEIGQIKPSGWHLAKYDVVDGKYLYNRCHLIGFQLAGENANEKNLITGTRYLNVTGMLPFENEVADYVKSTGNHVMYRVTPVFDGDKLVADGVQMEAYSVEDKGAGVQFNVFCYNVQPGIVIDYATGESRLSGESTEQSEAASVSDVTYIINKGTKKFHLPDCDSVESIKPQNKKKSDLTREELIESGYSPCSRCNP